RFGLYNDSPARDMFQNGQLLVVGDLNWNDGQWHHVVATWKNVNTGHADGSARIYIDGTLRGTMDGYEHRLSWDLDQLTIGLGQRYVGAIDELLILDCAIDADEVQQLNKLDGPVARLL
ncbi:MAG: LamG domain-containing protein, partial [Planctomycetaceae bacterium]|nr:LamG domain-containing protein [Planctomycetaceae bacterium]